MHRSEHIDWLLHYRAVLVDNAIRAIRETPLALTSPYASTRPHAWQNVPADANAWRTVAVAAGAVAQD